MQRNNIYILQKSTSKSHQPTFFKSSSPNKQGLNNTQEPTIFYPFHMSMYHRGKGKRKRDWSLLNHSAHQLPSRSCLQINMITILSQFVAITFMHGSQYDNHPLPTCSTACLFLLKRPQHIPSAPSISLFVKLRQLWG
jgi:hypothetical protein